MSFPSNKFSLAIIVAVFVSLLAGWSQAQELNVPKNAFCVVVRTTIEVDSKGRTIITIKKVCEANAQAK